MITENSIRLIVEEKLENTSFFLTNLVIRQGNQIHIYIDGDQGVTIDDCAMLSKYIESNLNRNEEDFTLQVSSAGIDQPLKFRRQYVRNIGRRFWMELKDGSFFTGKLLSVEGDKIQVHTEKQKGKMVIEDKIIELEISDINKALCLISIK